MLKVGEGGRVYSNEMMESDAFCWLHDIEPEELEPSLVPTMETKDMPNNTYLLKKLIRDMQFMADLQRNIIDSLSSYIECSGKSAPPDLLKGGDNPLDITGNNHIQ